MTVTVRNLIHYRQQRVAPAHIGEPGRNRAEADASESRCYRRRALCGS